MIDQQTEHLVPRANRRWEPESASHSTDVGELAGELGTDIESGLAEAVARRRLAEVGANRLPTPNRPPLHRRDGAVAATAR